MPKVPYQFNWVYIVNLAHIFTLNIRTHVLLVSLHCCLLLVIKYDDFIGDYFGKHVRNSPSMNKLQSPRCPERFFFNSCNLLYKLHKFIFCADKLVAARL